MLLCVFIVLNSWMALLIAIGTNTVSIHLYSLNIAKHLHVCSQSLSIFIEHKRFYILLIFFFISTEQRIVARQRVAALLLLRRRRARRRRRVWVHPINERRQEQGVYHNLVQELRADPERHRKYFRMNATEMDQILSIIGPDIGHIKV